MQPEYSVRTRHLTVRWQQPKAEKTSVKMPARWYKTTCSSSFYRQFKCHLNRVQKCEEKFEFKALILMIQNDLHLTATFYS